MTSPAAERVESPETPPVTPGQGQQGCSEHVAPEMLCSCSCSLFLETLICVTALSPPVVWCGTHRCLRLRAVEVGVEERGDITVTSLQRNGNSIVTILESKGEHVERGLGTGHSVGCPGPVAEPYTVHDGDVAGGLSQQQLHGLHAAVLAGAHQRGRALLVLQVHVGPAGEQSVHHLLPAMADGQHQRRLASLQGRDAARPPLPPLLLHAYLFPELHIMVNINSQFLFSKIWNN